MIHWYQIFKNNLRVNKQLNLGRWYPIESNELENSGAKENRATVIYPKKTVHNYSILIRVVHP